MKVALLIAAVFSIADAVDPILLPYQALPSVSPADQAAHLARIHALNHAIMTRDIAGGSPSCIQQMNDRVDFLSAMGSALGEGATDANVQAAFRAATGGFAAPFNEYTNGHDMMGTRRVLEVVKAIHYGQDAMKIAFQGYCSSADIATKRGAVAAAIRTIGATAALTVAPNPPAFTLLDYGNITNVNTRNAALLRFTAIFDLNEARLASANVSDRCKFGMQNVINFLQALEKAGSSNGFVPDTVEAFDTLTIPLLAVASPPAKAEDVFTKDERAKFVENAINNGAAALAAIGNTCDFSSANYLDKPKFIAAANAPKAPVKSRKSKSRKSKSRKPDAAATDDAAAAAKKKADEEAAAAAKKKADEEAAAAAAAKKDPTKKSGSGSGSKGSKGEEGSASVATTMVALSCAILAAIILG